MSDNFEIKAILDGIYGSVDAPVIIYNDMYVTVWNNSAAEILAEDIRKEIVVYIMKKGIPSGKLPFESGGRFHTIELFGEKYIVAEIYKENPIVAMYSQPRIAEHVFSSENEVRRAVSEIVYFCDDIESIGISEDQRFDLDFIIRACCRIMKNVTLGSQIKSAVFKEKNPDNIDLDAFLGEFASGCRRSMPDWDIQYDGNFCGVVFTDEPILTFFLLGLINSMAKSTADQYSGLRMKTETSDDTIALKIEMIPQESSEADTKILPLTDALAELLGVEYSVCGNTAEVRFKIVEFTEEFLFSAPKVISGEEIFSPFNIMLNDLNDFKNFY